MQLKRRALNRAPWKVGDDPSSGKRRCSPAGPRILPRFEMYGRGGSVGSRKQHSSGAQGANQMSVNSNMEDLLRWPKKQPSLSLRLNGRRSLVSNGGFQVVSSKGPQTPPPPMHFPAPRNGYGVRICNKASDRKGGFAVCKEKTSAELIPRNFTLAHRELALWSCIAGNATSMLLVCS